MIETHNRDPQPALQDVRALFAEAAEKNMIPVRLEIGFFQCRDMVDAVTGKRNRTRVGYQVHHFAGVPCVVTQLEDRVTLHCTDASGRIRTKFEYDRRASQL